MPPLPTYFFLAPLCPPWIYEDGSAALATDRHLQQRPLFLPEERFRGTETLRDPIVIPCSCVNDAAGRAIFGGWGGAPMGFMVTEANAIVRKERYVLCNLGGRKAIECLFSFNARAWLHLRDFHAAFIFFEVCPDLALRGGETQKSS
ncbi:hypothetical protein NDU88_002525 [Pleurodeles waltl]|uniref:Uncharacterized protein n=1 Tax=Pleurodeles waltl TaxID=8319 RepID=A0AAV7T2P0_PLEWA|nr:hypothetical protein NDU88_002525 [Pleurodeles waltl]